MLNIEKLSVSHNLAGIITYDRSLILEPLEPG